MGGQDGPRVGTTTSQTISLRRNRGTDTWRAYAPCPHGCRTRRATNDRQFIRLYRTSTRTQCCFAIWALHPHADHSRGVVLPMFGSQFSRWKSHCRWGRASQRARTCDALRAPPLAADVEQDLQHIPERGTTLRDRDGTEDDRAHVRPSSILLARTIATAGVPGGPPTVPEARNIAGIIGRVAVRASATRAFALRTADIAHVISLFTVPLRFVALLKQQSEFGLLTRAVVQLALPRELLLTTGAPGR